MYHSPTLFLTASKLSDLSLPSIEVHRSMEVYYEALIVTLLECPRRASILSKENFTVKTCKLPTNKVSDYKAECVTGEVQGIRAPGGVQLAPGSSGVLAP